MGWTKDPGFLVAVLLLLAGTNLTDGASRSSSRSYRSSSTYRYSSSYRSSSYSYRGPVYTRRLSPSLMGAMYFGYVSRYPSYFNYRRSVVGSSGTGACLNYLSLDNGSYVGEFDCPFLPDEPSTWTKCCGYDGEQFCCDPSYNDSWKFGAGLSVLTIALIVCGCLGTLVLLACLAFRCARKRGLMPSARTGEATAAAATPIVSMHVQQPQQIVPKLPDESLVAKQQGEWAYQQPQQNQPPPYPASAGTPNPGFEPAPYPLYPPPYGGEAIDNRS